MSIRDGIKRVTKRFPKTKAFLKFLKIYGLSFFGQRVLIYDIETTPLCAYIWRLGDQTVRSNQLKAGQNMYNIICIAYGWLDSQEVTCLVIDPTKQNCKELIRQFDEVLRTADISIGKNSDRFDVKHINTQRLLHDLPPFPEWMFFKDDLETQLRKYFTFPSHSLAFLSDYFGLGGKDKMEFEDWVDIVEKKPGFKAKLKKMVNYNMKDVDDTRALIRKVTPHVSFKSAFRVAKEPICETCGSKELTYNGTRNSGRTTYQMYQCANHGGYACKRTLSAAKKYPLNNKYTKRRSKN